MKNIQPSHSIGKLNFAELSRILALAWLMSWVGLSELTRLARLACQRTLQQPPRLAAKPYTTLIGQEMHVNRSGLGQTYVFP